MTDAIIDDPVFEGVGRLLHKILHKGWRTSQQNNTTYEDFFQDFTVLWMRARTKYDPSRGMWTTFATIVAKNFIRRRIQYHSRKGNLPLQFHGEYDKGGNYAALSPEEEQLVLDFENQQNKRHVGFVDRICQTTNRDKAKVLDLAESIRGKVQKRGRKATVILA